MECLNGLEDREELPLWGAYGKGRGGELLVEDLEYAFEDFEKGFCREYLLRRTCEIWVRMSRIRAGTVGMQLTIMDALISITLCL